MASKRNTSSTKLASHLGILFLECLINPFDYVSVPPFVGAKSWAVRPKESLVVNDVRGSLCNICTSGNCPRQAAAIMGVVPS